MKTLTTLKDLDTFSRSNSLSIRYRYHASVGFLLTLSHSPDKVWGGMGETLEQAFNRALIRFTKESNRETQPESSIKVNPKWEVCLENKIKPGYQWVCICGYSSFDRPHFRLIK